MDDLRRLQNINLDAWTETFHMNFYLSYLVRWPELCFVAETPDGTLAGYLIGKVEGTDSEWHAHVSAVSVAPEFRRCKLARRLMDRYEAVSEAHFGCYFSDLFVKSTNEIALNFYFSLGYVMFRKIIGYYNKKEDAFDLRKPLKRDTNELSIRDAGQTLTVK